MMFNAKKRYWIEKVKIAGHRLCRYYVWEIDDIMNEPDYIEEFRSYKSARKKYPTASYDSNHINDLTVNG